MTQRGEGEVLCLDLDIARPGDVLLLRPGGVPSLVIQTLTRSRATHAAIVAGDGVLIEATMSGSGHTVLVRVSGGPEVSEWGRLGLLSGARAGWLLRHPHFPDGESCALALRAANTYSGQYYPLILRLANTLARRRVLGPLATALAWCGERWPDRNKNLRGPFCSELVALTFQAAEVPLFADGRPAVSVSPADLRGAGLEVVRDGIISRPPPLGEDIARMAHWRERDIARARALLVVERDALRAHATDDPLVAGAYADAAVIEAMLERDFPTSSGRPGD